jgi:hypothetical protein
VGVVAGADRALLAGDMRHVTLWLAGAVLVLGGLYYLVVHRRVRSSTQGDRSRGPNGGRGAR